MVAKYKRFKAKATNENLSAVRMMSGRTTTAGSSSHHSDLHRQWPTRIRPSTYQPKPPSSDHRRNLSLCVGRNQALAWQTFIDPHIGPKVVWIIRVSSKKNRHIHSWLNCKCGFGSLHLVKFKVLTNELNKLDDTETIIAVTCVDSFPFRSDCFICLSHRVKRMKKVCIFLFQILKVFFTVLDPLGCLRRFRSTASFGMTC